MYQDRWYQNEAEFSIYEYFSHKKGNPIVAMPTGTGKSLVIAKFIKNVFSRWPNQKIMMLTHVKKLIEQNAEKLQDIWSTAPIGIHNAEMRKRDLKMPIIFGSVQSVAPTIKKAVEEISNTPYCYRHFGHVDLILIDECHLVSPEESTRYAYVISELQKINPMIKVVGFSATPYRMGFGHLTDAGGIFSDVCYDLTGVEAFNRLIFEGYIAPLIPMPTRNEINVDGVKIVGGEFNQKQLEAVSDDNKLVHAIAGEMCQMAHDRSSWLVFCSGIDSSEHMAGVLREMNIEAQAVHSKLSNKINDDRIEAFKHGDLRCVVNMNKLTTGIDCPGIDYIGDCNATISVPKHVQKLGRGTRPSPATGKLNCLVGDFARNVPRLGPINAPRIPNRKGKGGGDMPVRICDNCGCYNHAAARHCISCGYEFTFEQKLFTVPSNVPIIKSDDTIIEYFDVSKVIYNLHEKKNAMGVLTSPPMIRAMYFCGLRRFDEYVTLEHKGMAGHRAREWWRARHAEEPPPTTFEALRRVSQLRQPTRIRVHLNAEPFPQILAAEF